MAKKVHDVAIIGGGFAGISTAWHLAKDLGMRDVAVIAERLPKGGTGLCQAWIGDHLNRVAHGVGEDEAVALWRYLEGGVQQAERMAHGAGSEVTAGGSIHLATFPAETKDLEESAEIMKRADLTGRMVPSPLDGREGRPKGLAGLYVLGDLSLRPPHILPRLQRRLEDLGVRFHVGQPATSVRVEDQAVHVQVGDATVSAEVCVIACGAWADKLHRFFEGRVIPVRAQGFWITLPAGGEDILRCPVSASWGHEVYLVRGNQLIAAGMRPDSRDDDVGFGSEPTGSFQGFLRRFCRERIPGISAEVLEGATPFAGTVTVAEDGLPIVGPLPGTERLIAAVGFGFRGLAGSVASGRAVARLVTGSRDVFPRCLSARRFL